MRVDLFLPLAAAFTFAVLAPALARRLPPATATWLLSVGSLVAAAGTVTVLALLSWTLVGQSPLVAAQGHWSVRTLRQDDPVAVPVAVLALLLLLVIGARVSCAAFCRGRALRQAYRLAADLPSQAGSLVVIDDQDGTDRHAQVACAVPGRPGRGGRVVISAGLLRRLDAGGRRALLAHEQSHLDHHHHWHGTAVQLAAAANPALARLRPLVALTTERWADEDAAAASNRPAVASALTTASRAIGTPGTSGPGRFDRAGLGAVLAAAVEQVPARLTALQRPAPRMTLWRLAVLCAVIAAVVMSTAEAMHETERLFEAAMRAYQASP